MKADQIRNRIGFDEKKNHIDHMHPHAMPMLTIHGFLLACSVYNWHIAEHSLAMHTLEVIIIIVMGIGLIRGSRLACLGTGMLALSIAICLVRLGVVRRAHNLQVPHIPRPPLVQNAGALEIQTGDILLYRDNCTRGRVQCLLLNTPWTHVAMLIVHNGCIYVADMDHQHVCITTWIEWKQRWLHGGVGGTVVGWRHLCGMVPTSVYLPPETCTYPSLLSFCLQRAAGIYPKPPIYHMHCAQLVTWMCYRMGIVSRLDMSLLPGDFASGGRFDSMLKPHIRYTRERAVFDSALMDP